MSFFSNPRRNRPQLTVEALEQRDLLAATLALPLTANLGNLATPVARTQTLGDTAAGAREVELYQVDLQAGQVLTAATSQVGRPRTPTDTYLRLFDAVGRQLACDNDSGGNLYSRLNYAIPQSGTYYLGVSGNGNTAYDLFTRPRLAPGATGPYALAVSATTSNLAPTLQPVADVSTNHDRPAQVTLQASDPNGDPVTLTAALICADSPAQATLAISGNILKITPAAGYAGTFAVRVTASDGKLATSQTFSVTVQPNQAPILGAIADQTLPQGQTSLTLRVAASDLDGDTVRLSATVVGDSGVAAVSVVRGNLMVVPQNGYTGAIRIRVTASDGMLSSTQDFTVYVVGAKPTSIPLTAASPQANPVPSLIISPLPTTGFGLYDPTTTATKVVQRILTPSSTDSNSRTPTPTPGTGSGWTPTDNDPAMPPADNVDQGSYFGGDVNLGCLIDDSVALPSVFDWSGPFTFVLW